MKMGNNDSGIIKYNNKKPLIAFCIVCGKESNSIVKKMCRNCYSRLRMRGKLAKRKNY